MDQSYPKESSKIYSKSYITMDQNFWRVHSGLELSKESWKIYKNFLRIHSGSELIKKNSKFYSKSYNGLEFLENP